MPCSCGYTAFIDMYTTGVITCSYQPSSRVIKCIYLISYLGLKCLHCILVSYVQALFYLTPSLSLSLRHCRSAILMTISSWACVSASLKAFTQLRSTLISEILRWSFLSFFFPSDLDHFKVHTRSAVSVREGQGVVLLCGTPTSSGGKLSGLHLNLQHCSYLKS